MKQTSTNRKYRKSNHFHPMDPLRQLSPAILERHVRVLLVRMGYKILEKNVKDGFLILDPLASHILYVRIWAYPYVIPGRPSIQSFVGEITGSKVDGGLLITPMWFSAPALKYAESIHPKVILKEGKELFELFTEYGLSV